MDSQFDKGLATRKQVMGEDFVARAFGGATDFTAPIQQYITRNAWGDVWQRPGLDLKTRSLITVAMLIALGKQHELKGHVRGDVYWGWGEKAANVAGQMKSPGAMIVLLPKKLAARLLNGK